jgi:hypothetical protein
VATGIGCGVTKLCFYCRTRFQKNPTKTHLNTNAPTKDHVYPRGVPLPALLVSRDNRSNQVLACHWCNSRKGQKHPLLWLTMCPSKEGATDLAALMKKLGEREDLIDLAMKRWETINDGSSKT